MADWLVDFLWLAVVQWIELVPLNELKKRDGASRYILKPNSCITSSYLFHIVHVDRNETEVRL